MIGEFILLALFVGLWVWFMRWVFRSRGCATCGAPKTPANLWEDFEKTLEGKEKK
jgi:hypothetical protein